MPADAESLDLRPLTPLTPREALFAIHALISGAPKMVNHGLKVEIIALDPEELRGLVAAGLAPAALDTYTLTDRLADKLAEAHFLLEQVLHAASGEFSRELLDRVHEAITLSPDIEAMVERRRSIRAG